MIDPAARADAVETFRLICAGGVHCGKALEALRGRVAGCGDATVEMIVGELCEGRRWWWPEFPGDDGWGPRVGDRGRLERAARFLEAGFTMRDPWRIDDLKPDRPVAGPGWVERLLLNKWTGTLLVTVLAAGFGAGAHLPAGLRYAVYALAGAAVSVPVLIGAFSLGWWGWRLFRVHILSEDLRPELEAREPGENWWPFLDEAEYRRARRVLRG